MSTYKFNCGCEVEIKDPEIKEMDGLPSLYIDYYNLPDCYATWDLIGTGHTKGIFQLETNLGKGWAKKVQPRSIDEMAALIAILRPGSLKAIIDGKSITQHYTDRKSGEEEVEYFHEALEPILENTYGLLCIHEDTFISMSDGTEKRIKHLKSQDKTLSYNDRYKCNNDICVGVIKSPKKYGVKLILENGYEIILTPDHKVLTQNGMVKIQDLDCYKHVVGIAKKQKKWYSKSEINKEKYDKLSKNDIHIAYLCGQLLGAGCEGKCIASGTQKHHKKILDWLNCNFSNSLNIREYFHCRSNYIALSGKKTLRNKNYGNRKTIYRWFLEQLTLDKTRNNKIIHDEIFKLNDKSRRSFLAGLFDANGHSSKFCCHYCTTNPQVLNGIRKLLSMDGIETYIYKNHLHIFNSKKFKKIIEPYLVVKEITVITNGSSVKKMGYKFGDISFMRIKKIEKIEKPLKFYSISIQNNHNLVGNGVIISNCFQEQSIRISQDIAGLSLEESDSLRKAIGKKLPELMTKVKTQFLEGCEKKGIVNQEQAEEIFSWIEKSQKYQFNASHSVGYGETGYWSAWAKTHFPFHFYTSSLFYAKEKLDPQLEVRQILSDAKNLNIEVDTPSIKHLEIGDFGEFSLYKGKIRFGINNIKKIGIASSKKLLRIVKEKEEKLGKKIGDWSWYDILLHLCGENGVTTTTINGLIYVGAFSHLNSPRTKLLYEYSLWNKLTKKEKRFLLSQTSSRLKDGLESLLKYKLTPSRRKKIEDLLESLKTPPTTLTDTVYKVSNWELDLLGVPITYSKLDNCNQDKVSLANTTCKSVAEGSVRSQDKLILAGELTAVKEYKIKTGANRGATMAFLEVEDDTGTADCVVFQESWTEFRHIFYEGNTVLLTGYLSKRGGMIVEKAKSL